MPKPHSLELSGKKNQILRHLQPMLENDDRPIYGNCWYLSTCFNLGGCLEDLTAERRFLNLQNRFRGLVGNLRTRRFVEVPTKIDPIRKFRTSLNELYLDMRAELTVDQYPEMISWVNSQITGQLYEVVHAPMQYDELSGIYATAPVISLERELMWVAHRLSMNWDNLSLLVAAIEPISASTLHGRYEDALALLALMQEKLGVSLWSVQLRIALEHQAGGLERQKRYAADVRKIYKRGLLGFTTYHTSVRNEDRTTVSKFLDDVEHRINNHIYYDEPLKNYSRYRLKGEIPPGSEAIADILRIEQNHTIQDVYQTFIAVIQELVARGPSEDLRKIILIALSIIPADDFRVIKIIRHLDHQHDLQYMNRELGVLENLLEGNIQAANSFAKLRLAESTDAWDIIYAGLARTSSSLNLASFALRPTNLAKGLGAIFGRALQTAEIGAQLSKLTLNFRGLPFAAALANFEGTWRRLQPDADWAPFKVGLNSPTTGIEDLRPGNKLSGGSPDHNLKATEWWKTALGLRKDAVASNEAGKLANAIAAVSKGNADIAIALTNEVDLWSEPQRSFGVLVRLHALTIKGDRKAIVSLISSEGSRGSAYSHLLPIQSSLKLLRWPDFKEVGNPLAPSIALNLLWIMDDDSKTASLLRFAASFALRNPLKRKPSEFEERSSEYTKEELIYFLRYVCGPNILDQARIVSGTRAIMEERQAICSLLLELDPKNTTHYNEEITNIAEQLAIDEGQWIVDSTRIYVDLEALNRWAQRELTEDFGRYIDLVGVEVGHVQSFEDVLRELLETNPASKSIYVPETEAEAVLVSMLRRLGQEFLSNPMFGLDFNLSKRVRHQSFIGLIRGPLETAQLITSRESEAGDYHTNSHWLNKFTKGKDEIDVALKKFATFFDDTLIDAKDTALHLRSAEKPEGLIVLNLSAHHIAIARGVIKLAPSFTEFLAVAIVILWTAIDASLQSARDLISIQLKTQLTNGFDELRASVRTVAEGDEAFWEFDSAVGLGSAEVQTRLDEAANWFQRADKIRAETTFTLDQVVKIAADTALKSQRNYSPNLQYEVEGDILLYAGNLIFVHDVLFVALGNAHKHSGLKSPTVNVHVRHDPISSTLEIEAVCDTRGSSRAVNEEKIKAIRSLIDSGSIAPHTRKEGQSGFVKLAAVVGQSPKGKIEFGYTLDGRFRLAVTYAVANLPERQTDVA